MLVGGRDVGGGGGAGGIPAGWKCWILWAVPSLFCTATGKHTDTHRHVNLVVLNVSSGLSFTVSTELPARER